jgi:cysteine synthase A
MNAAEMEISCSTPGCQFGQVSGSAAAASNQKISLDFGASRFFTETIEREPVVMFALEWCEFCWSARKLFKKLGVECHSVDLDSVAYQKDERGLRIREVLNRRLGVSTIPQLFVGGEHIGGCTELFDAYRNGELQGRFNEHGIDFEDGTAIDTQSLLPQWIHPRKSA